MSTYRGDMVETFDCIKSDAETIKSELELLLDMDDIEDIKLSISDVIQTVNVLIGELR